MTTSIPVPAADDPGATSQLEQTERATTAAGSHEAPPRARQREFAERPPRWYQIIWSSGKARTGICLLAFFVLVAIFAPVIAPYDPQDGSFAPLLSPSWDHLMGTTSQGYDIFSQFVYGTRLSLLVGIFGGAFATVLAVFVGMTSGYAEGTVVDSVLSFFTNLALVVPVLPLMMVIIAYSEVRGLWLMVFVIGITSWAVAARAKRAQIITLR
ncbi:MAG TPA: ABC transporter permease, partial [Microlunatus sp.]|nr:ABC transporter permease [Microlunatus sp.]